MPFAGTILGVTLGHLGAGAGAVVLGRPSPFLPLPSPRPVRSFNYPMPTSRAERWLNLIVFRFDHHYSVARSDLIATALSIVWLLRGE